MNFETTLRLPERTQKPRSYGENMILEKGMPLQLFESYLADYHTALDYIKFTSGMGLVDVRVPAKIAACARYGIPCFFGGSLFEKFYRQQQIPAYLQLLREAEITVVEISNGIIEITPQEMTEAIRFFKQEGFTVFTEVGSKDTDYVMPPSAWIREIETALAAGSSKLILEGRESGTAGLYRGSGEIRTGLLEEIYNQTDIRQIIFEAPNKRAQCYLINTFGSNINLGNLRLEDVNMVEVQRLGLRYDTFNVGQQVN